MKKSSLLLPAAWLLLASGCVLESEKSKDDDAEESGERESDAGRSDAGGSHANADGGHSKADAGAPSDEDEPPASDDIFKWSTGEFKVDPGQERYLCFTKTLEEDLVVGGYSTKGASFVHHLILVRERAPEPDGFAECNTAFRASWDPIFITGAGAAELSFPSDAGHKLAKGTRVLVQMHLLNTGDEPVTGKLNIDMHRSAHKDPRPVSSYVFGTADVLLPAKKKTDLVGTCAMREPVQLIAGFPHMHRLATAQRFEVGASESTLKEVFKRDPYYFDDQSIEPVDVTLKPGDVTRVTCSYSNTSAQDVKYGESTNDEMCYFIGFAVDRETTSGCLGSAPPAGTAQR